MGMDIDIFGVVDGKEEEIASMRTSGAYRLGIYIHPFEYALQCVVEPWDSDWGRMPITLEQLEQARAYLFLAACDKSIIPESMNMERAELFALTSNALTRAIWWMDDHPGATAYVVHRT